MLKDRDDAEIARAILAVGYGEAIVSPASAARMARFFVDRSAGVAIAFPRLTASECDVPRLPAAGTNNQAIARRLGLRPKTVRDSVSITLGQPQVADRARAIVRARQAGMG